MGGSKTRFRSHAGIRPDHLAGDGRSLAIGSERLLCRDAIWASLGRNRGEDVEAGGASSRPDGCGGAEERRQEEEHD